MRELQVTPQLLHAVSDRISQQYIQLGLELGLPFEQILQFRMNNRAATVKIIREILGEWFNIHQADNTATIDGLALTLFRCGCSVRPLLEFVDQSLVPVENKATVADANVDRRSGKKCLVM